MKSSESGASYSIKRLTSAVYYVRRTSSTKTECNQSEMIRLKEELNKLKSEKKSLEENMNNLKISCQESKSQLTPQQKQRTSRIIPGSYRTWSNSNQLDGKLVQPTPSSASTSASQNPQYPIVRFNIGFT